MGDKGSQKRHKHALGKWFSSGALQLEALKTHSWKRALSNSVCGATRCLTQRQTWQFDCC